MRKCLTTMMWVAAVAGMSLPVQANITDAAADRFATIPQRNLFGLRPAPQAQPVTAPPPTLPKIVLTGITTILGNKRALMKAQPPPGSPPSVKEQSLILTEGQRDGAIEVLTIDEHAGSVKVDNSGTQMTLTFEKDGPKLPATPPPQASPASPPALPGYSAAPAGFGAATNAVPAPAPATGQFVLPSRTPRGMPQSAPGTTGPGTIPSVPSPLPPTGGNPVPAVSLPPLPGQQQPNGLTPEEEAIIQQLQRETQAHSSAALPQTAPPPGTPQAGVTTVMPPGFKTPSTVAPGSTAGRLPPQ